MRHDGKVNRRLLFVEDQHFNKLAKKFQQSAGSAGGGELAGRYNGVLSKVGHAGCRTHKLLQGIITRRGGMAFDLTVRDRGAANQSRHVLCAASHTGLSRRLICVLMPYTRLYLVLMHEW
jgi:hypothetical protein